MESNKIDFLLAKKLNDLGAIRLNRSISYQNFIINDVYLSSEVLFTNYCTVYAFNRANDISKRKTALLLATKIINYSK